MEAVRPRLTENDLWTLRLALAHAIDDSMTSVRHAPTRGASNTFARSAREFVAMYARIREMQGERAQGERRRDNWLEEIEMLLADKPAEPAA